MKIDRSKWEPCKYCEGGIYSDFAYDYSMGEDTGNYCKYCGRPMLEQAWEELERRVFGCADQKILPKMWTRIRIMVYRMVLR